MEIKDIGGGRIAIDTPYNPEFVKKIKAVGAKWDPSSKTWQTDARFIEAVREIMRVVYGQDDRPQELVNVQVVVRDEDMIFAQKAFVLFGRTVAAAKGRDGGARVGEGVVFSEGGARSGGSVKNWATIVSAGSRFTIYDVPLAAVGSKLGWDDDIGSFSVLSPADPLAELRQEKEALLSRIAEIDSLLDKGRVVPTKDDPSGERE